MKLLNHEFQRQDSRGSLTQVFSGPGWQQLNLLQIKGGNTFGGHYHKKRTELFCLLSGEVEFHLQDVLIKTGTSYLITPDMGKVVIVEPFETHTLQAREDSVLVELLSQPFQKEDSYV